MTLDDWRALVTGWRDGQAVLVNVGELSALIERCALAEQFEGRVEEWMRTDPMCSDSLRKSLYPPRGSVPPERRR